MITIMIIKVFIVSFLFFSHVSTMIHLSIHLAGLLNKKIRGLVGG